MKELFLNAMLSTGWEVLMTDGGIRFGINLVMILTLVHLIYYRYKKNNEYAFTFTLFNIIIFFICFLMFKAEISMGFAFGLFAIFGVLRYRTTTIPIKEMTYLFTAIALALISAIGPDYISLFLVNFTIVLSIFILEKLWFAEKESYKNIQYEKIELLQDGNHGAVIEDIKNRSGLDVTRIEVKSFNFLNDSADIKVYYKL